MEDLLLTTPPPQLKHHWYPGSFPSPDWDSYSTHVPRLCLESWI